LNQILDGIVNFVYPARAFATDAAPEAAAAASPQQSLMGTLPLIIGFVLIFYFLMYRPQKKKQQQHDKMINSIARGDSVITAGGFFGRVSEVLEDSYILEIADGTKARILKGSITSKREGGDDKSRPRKLRKKKRPRPVSAESAAAATEPPQSSETPAAASEGITAEENSALIAEISETKQPSERENSDE
jgi:preprotein translocase subunit YajC